MLLNKFRIRTGWVAVCLACVFSLYLATAGAQTPSRQRYVGLMLLNLSPDGGPERRLIQMAHEYGLNSVYLTIHWDKVYVDSPDKADWSQFDEQIRTIVNQGMYVALRIHLTRPKGKLKGFWDWEKDGLKDHKKISHMGSFTATTFRYNHLPSAALAADFVRQVAERYKWVHDQGKLLFIATSNTPEQESGFPYENFEPDTETPDIYLTVFDNSDETVAQYKEWLKGHYKKIERLNYAWGMTFKSFEEANPYIVPWDPRESFKQRYGKDWYRFRHEQLKKYIETLVAAVKSVSPTMRYISDFGSVLDELSGLRATIAFPNLSEKTDGIKINNVLYWDHRFTMDVLRGGMPKGAFLGNEVFINSDATPDLITRQVNECFEHGADFVGFVVSLENVFARIQGPVRQAAATWKTRPKENIVDLDSISYSLIRTIDAKSMLDLVYGAYKMYADKTPGVTRPIKVKIEDDMFVPSYWAVASNRLPFLKTPIPMQIKAIGKPFSVTIPKDHFGDMDGRIEKIEMPNLPSWLSFDGETLKGTGSTLGDTRLEVRGIDDEGGAFSAYLTLRIDPTDNTNIPPTLQINFSDLVARINENYVYELPSAMFADADGSISKIEAFDLPSWLRFSGNRFTGKPTALGEYQVTLKAFDNQNAFVETYLLIRVLDKNFFNTAPKVTKPIPTLFSPENKYFRFDIPAETFTDTDGYVTHMMLHAHPTWLSLTFGTVAGMPPGNGEYKFFVRAFDNNGSFVDAPVVLRVEEASLRFTLQSAGDVIDPEIVGLIEEGQVFHVDSIPAFLNIGIDGNYPFDRVRMKLRGPYAYESRTRKHPYTLYQGKNGFAPSIGRYDLMGEAYTWDDSLLYITSTYFFISRGSGTNLTGDMPEWTSYPVPFQDILNVKTSNDPNESYQFAIVLATGQRVSVPDRFIKRTGNLYQINFTELGLSSGLYLVHASQDGIVRKQLRVVKK
ncbi:putative Ig domain-containing protein [Ravibacter arvi]